MILCQDYQSSLRVVVQINYICVSDLLRVLDIVQYLDESLLRDIRNHYKVNDLDQAPRLDVDELDLIVLFLVEGLF